VSAAETLEEVVVVVEAHNNHASAGQRHALVIKGALDVQNVAFQSTEVSG
jgi:hypothetical protein